MYNIFHYLSININYFYVSINILIFNLSIYSVSHTTDDLIFEWLPDDLIPLVVEPGKIKIVYFLHFELKTNFLIKYYFVAYYL